MPTSIVPVIVRTPFVSRDTAPDIPPTANYAFSVLAPNGAVLADAEVSPAVVADQVGRLLNDGPRLAAMTKAATLVGHPEAAQHVAQVVLDVAKQARSGGGRR